MKKMILSMLAVALLITVNAQAQGTLGPTSGNQVLAENFANSISNAIEQNTEEISGRDRKVERLITEMVERGATKKAKENTRYFFQKLNDTLKNNLNPEIRDYVVYTEQSNLLYQMGLPNLRFSDAVLDLIRAIDKNLLEQDFLKEEIKAGKQCYRALKGFDRYNEVCVTYKIYDNWFTGNKAIELNLEVGSGRI